MMEMGLVYGKPTSGHIFKMKNGGLFLTPKLPIGNILSKGQGLKIIYPSYAEI